MSASVIMLEFNELSPPLMKDFIDRGLLPAFRRLRGESVAAVTDAGEEGPCLEPWIQWTTAHAGRPYSEHRVFKLSDGPQFQGPRIWDVVSDAGGTVWICGSMNAAIRRPPINGLLLPDPWASDLRPQPDAYFAPYYDFVRRHVQEHASGGAPVTAREMLSFARFMVSNGLSARTAAGTLRQLAAEQGGAQKWKRASILDRLQWDVFRHNFKRLRPTLSTFFLNSTAHYQHYYWRDQNPELFAIKPDPQHAAEHRDAILYGYQQMDLIVREALALCDAGTSLVLCTGLSQQPMLKYEESGGKLCFRPSDIGALAALAGVESPYRHVPVMAEEFQLHFQDDAAAEGAAERLESLRLADGTPVMRVSAAGSRLYCGCALISDPGPEAAICAPHTNRSTPFFEQFHPLEGIKSGIHHPDGLLWIRAPQRASAQVSRKVSLEEIAPTLAFLCGVDPSPFPRPVMPEIHALERAEAA